MIFNSSAKKKYQNFNTSLNEQLICFSHVLKAVHKQHGKLIIKHFRFLGKSTQLFFAKHAHIIFVFHRAHNIFFYHNDFRFSIINFDDFNKINNFYSYKSFLSKLEDYGLRKFKHQKMYFNQCILFCIFQLLFVCLER